MADPVVGITNGVPTSGTGTITTLGQTLTDGANATLGANADAVSLTGSISAKLRAIATALGTTALDLGSGTGGSRTLRVYQDPSSQNANGTTTDANSTPVAWSTEGKAQVGAVGETAPASDTASSGLNGRLQRIAQRLTSLIALFGPQTTGGLDTYYNADLDEAAVAVKASAGGLFNVAATNRTTAPLYLHFWNVAQGSVTVGTTPVKFTLEIPANANDHTLAMPNWNPHGVAFTTAITAAVTTALAGTGAPSANACVITIAYK